MNFILLCNRVYIHTQNGTSFGEISNLWAIFFPNKKIHYWTGKLNGLPRENKVVTTENTEENPPKLWRRPSERTRLDRLGANFDEDQPMTVCTRLNSHKSLPPRQKYPPSFKHLRCQYVSSNNIYVESMVRLAFEV